MLYIDESGVPLPFAPNELLLIVAGLLISTGGLNPFIFFPFALLAMCGGVLTAYGWAKAIGPPGLRRFAARLHAQHHYDRATARLQHASAFGIFVARMLPGVRIYATLVCGASAVPPRRFALGAFPAAAIWCFFFTIIGMLFGLPAEHVLSRVQQSLFRGALLIGLGAAAYLAARHVPADVAKNSLTTSVPTSGRYAGALGLDFGIVASTLMGLLAIARYALDIRRHYATAQVAGVVAVLAIMYIVVSRRGPGATLGERLFDVTYRKVGHRDHAHPDDAPAHDAEPPADL